MQNEIRTGLFIDSLFVIVKDWKQSLHRIERASERDRTIEGETTLFYGKGCELEFRNFEMHY